MERWKGGENGKSNYEKPNFDFDAPVFAKTDKLNNNYSVRMNTLDDSHEAIQYFKSRGILFSMTRPSIVEKIAKCKKINEAIHLIEEELYGQTA